MTIDAGPWTSAGALFDDDFSYRYRLWREWDPNLPTLAFLMLNPSDANSVKLDPTVRRCVGFAKAWGFGRLEVINAFAWVDSNPEGLLHTKDPVGPENDKHILEVAGRASQIIIAWSGWVACIGGPDFRRDKQLDQLLLPHATRLFVLGFCQDGSPRHPLYLPKSAQRIQYVQQDAFNFMRADVPNFDELSDFDRLIQNGENFVIDFDSTNAMLTKV